MSDVEHADAKATAKAEVKTKAKEPVVPMMVNTPSGNVLVWGHEHVSRKLLEVLGVVLTHDAFELVYHGIKSVVFRTDGFPKENGRNVCATFAPDVCGIAINMEKTLERTIDRSMDNPETSLMASWWIEMLLNFGHEIHHGVEWDSNRSELAFSEAKREKEEESAEKYSSELIEELVKDYDIEPPENPADETWLYNQLMELFGGKTDAWATAQKDMLGNNIYWKHTPEEGEAITLYSFKDLICLISKGDTEAEEWNKPTIQIKPGVKTLDEQLNGEIISTAPVTQPPPANTNNAAYNTAEGEIEDAFEIDYEAPFAEDVPVQPLTPAFNFSSVLQNNPTQMPSTVIQHDGDSISRIAKSVYMKIYNFIFRNCLPQKDNDVGFAYPEAVLSTPILLTPEESTIFVSMNHNDINGRWCTDVGTMNGLLGKIMKNTKLPSYELILNVNGAVHKRLVLPQNPAKRNPAGQLTQRALEARAGNAIAYVINPDDDTEAKYGPSIVNGEYKVPQLKR